MKKCSDCNVEMIDNIKLRGQHPFELGVDGRSDLLLDIPTDEKGKMLGFEYDKVNTLYIRSRMCPNCLKIELYAAPYGDKYK